MLGMEDKLYGHPMYGKAAGAAVRLYLELHDNPPRADHGADHEAMMAGMSAEDRKKFKLQKKKEVGTGTRGGGRASP